MHRPAVLMALLLTVSGCLGGGSTSGSTTGDNGTARLVAWTPLSCDDSGITQAGKNADLVSGLQGSAEAIAKRIADGLGEPITGPGEFLADHPQKEWPTAQGHISVQFLKDGGPFLAAAYMKDRGTWTTAQVTAMAESLGADKAALKSSLSGRNGQVWQEWDHSRVTWTYSVRGGANWFPTQTTMYLGIGPLYQFQVEKATVNSTQAMKSAETYLRCQLDAEGKTEAKGFRINQTIPLGVTVKDNAIVHLINIHYTEPKSSICGAWDARWVYVDAVTGAILGNIVAACI